ncbi:MAG: transcription-repair coupling factor [Desulfatiglandales bacterium]
MEVEEIIRRLEEEDLSIEGVEGSGLAFVLSLIFRRSQRSILVITPGHKELEEIEKAFGFFLGEDSQIGPPFVFRGYDISPLSGMSPNPTIIRDRIEALYSLIYHQKSLVITSLDALLGHTVPKREVGETVEMVQVGEELDILRFSGTLLEMGYERTGLVENYGEFTLRGAVIDLFSPLWRRPLRIEVWGDRVESIREFNPLSQRSEAQIKEAIILPSKEILRRPHNKKRALSMGKLPHPHGAEVTFSGEEAWIYHFYETPGTLMEYLRPNSLVILIEDHRYEGLYKNLLEKIEKERSKHREMLSQKGEPCPLLLEPRSLSDIYSDLSFHRKVYVRPKGMGRGVKGLSWSPNIHEALEPFSLKLQRSNRPSLVPFVEKAESWVDMGGTVIVVLRTDKQSQRVGEILQNYHITPRGHLERWSWERLSPGLYTCEGPINRGFLWPEMGLYVVTEAELFGAKRGYGKRVRTDLLSSSFLTEIRSGDLVVHQEHGIGRYLGLTRMVVGETEGEFAVIQYANGDKLYIPADKSSLLEKYVGIEGIQPKLDVMGGHTWRLAKKKAKSSVYKIAKELVDLYALREIRKGFSFSPPDRVFREFEATFPYEETPDQSRCIEEVLSDMMSQRPMDRLICGDVGFGKTEVAIRAAFKAVQDGKQVCVLAPTTLLTEQHLRTFKERMAPFGVKVESISRFKTKGEQERILNSLRSGDVDVIIGTHRLLQNDVVFRDLGLLIVDEEQRFGVKQKELIKGIRSTVDVISMTATPIPRTLQMSLLGIKEISIIETPPENRHSVETLVSVYDKDIIREAIISEINRKGQVFYVYNQVRDIQNVYKELKEIVPEARIAIAHGQMDSRELESTMLRFLNLEIDVLLSTTIIESGLDIPTANTIIIDGVERMGLAQVYQLRGRVGRSEEKAFAFLMVREPSKLSPEAQKRLKALGEFTHLGAGLALSLHDLKIRGGGNILGFKQSGHIGLVGYETYLRLIQEAISELKGEELTEEINPEIRANIKAYIPSEYIDDPDTRLAIYRRLSGLKDESEMERIRAELLDRFGPPLEPVENLLWVMGLRICLKRVRCIRIEVFETHATMGFESKKAQEGFLQALGKRGVKFSLAQGERVKVYLRGNTKRRLLEILGYRSSP